MKKLLYLILLSLLFLFPMASHAQFEKVIDFGTDIVINQDSLLVVNEQITYDFGTEQRHGIYRDIIEKYQRDSGNYYIDINVISVTDDKGNVWPYETSSQGIYYRIKIGDADKYVTGQQVYNIKYEVKGAVNYFEDHDELYWNVTGTEWPGPIKKAQATVHLPTELEVSQLQKTCYTGVLGSRESDCQANIVDGKTADFFSNSELSAGEGLTIVLGWPKGIVAVQKPVSSPTTKLITLGLWSLILPVLVFIILLYLWNKKGRDPRGRGTIIPQYESPDNLPPGAMGVVLDEKTDPKDISATIVDLAVKGYLKIKQIEEKKIFSKSTDYEFTKLKEADKNLSDYEKKIFNNIFDSGSSKKLSDLKNKFYTHLKEIKDTLYYLVVEKNYFPFNPDKVRLSYFIVGLVLAIIGGFGIFTAFFLGFTAFSILLSGAIIMIFSRFMPRRTQKGAEVLEEILGFKMFLSVTEKDRIKFHNAPEKKPEQFEKFLPYAMVFGVEKEWAKQFEGIYNTPPSWYEGDFTTFSALYLAISLSSLSQAASTAIYSHPGGGAGGGMSGFGGGGFSGGGFGGGGGGSW